MKFRTVEVKTIKVTPLCDCGEEYTDISNGTVLNSYPAKKAFMCLRCKDIINISEPSWPHVVFEEVER
jgi:hypothetical protein